MHLCLNHSTHLYHWKKRNLAGHLWRPMWHEPIAYLEIPFPEHFICWSFWGHRLESQIMWVRRMMLFERCSSQIILTPDATEYLQSIIDNILLLEIMEVREKIENASSDEELRPFLQSCQVKQKELCEQLAASFREDRIDDAKVLTAKLQYWNRIEETIMDKISCVSWLYINYEPVYFRFASYKCWQWKGIAPIFFFYSLKTIVIVARLRVM